MRNLSIFLLVLALVAVVLSYGVRERRSFLDDNDNKAALEVLLKAIDEGKVDINDLVDDSESNPSRRLWFPIRVRFKGRK
ncbi:hypothetical protein ACJMK2_002556 [Sinanodonta woodiana]|uniref:Uncharacterized protein n=1 Tax=Sinanodonta woodiana TaxID=1069815 RepID=A0ABD3XXW3_SINWO